MDNAEGWFFRGGKGPDWEYITERQGKKVRELGISLKQKRPHLKNYVTCEQ